MVLIYMIVLFTYSRKDLILCSGSQNIRVGTACVGESLVITFALLMLSQTDASKMLVLGWGCSLVGAAHA